ncbi:MAG: TIGR00730 family Rossman fold protein [Alphaproteobacteria bacterium]|nr:TIGR00730 family Rossman fold protein [Alphaproteobacteria bacterium]
MPQSHSHDEGFSLCVFCGSRRGEDPDFVRFAKELGKNMAESNVRLVFGGGAVGLMGAVSDAVLEHGGRATGVIPEFLDNGENGHQSAEMIVVPDMHTRKRTMFERSDAFCVLPGGIGTLEEFFEIITWRQLSVHNKPVILSNWNGYWDNLVAMTETMNRGGFSYGPTGDLFIAVRSVAEILPAIRQNWSDSGQISGPAHPDLSKT